MCVGLGGAQDDDGEEIIIEYVAAPLPELVQGEAQPDDTDDQDTVGLGGGLGFAQPSQVGRGTLLLDWVLASGRCAVERGLAAAERRAQTSSSTSATRAMHAGEREHRGAEAGV